MARKTQNATIYDQKPFNAQVGINIRLQRLKHVGSQGTLAYLAGFKPYKISAIESGVPITLEELEILSPILGAGEIPATALKPKYRPESPPVTAYDRLTFYQKIGWNIYSRRTELGLIQKDLGERINVTPPQIARTEAGDRAILLDEFQHLSIVLGCEPIPTSAIIPYFNLVIKNETELEPTKNRE